MALRILSRSHLRLTRPSTNKTPTTLGILTPYQIRTQSNKSPIPLKITPQSPAASRKVLAAQRLNRPLSPHLSIYKPQITSVLSSLTRITGLIFSGSLYLFSTAYLVSPYLDWDLSSATLAAGFAGLLVAVKVGAKFMVALPFTFHCFNGVRNLVWASARFLGNRQVIRSGWATVGFAVVGAVGLACFV